MFLLRLPMLWELVFLLRLADALGAGVPEA